VASSFAPGDIVVFNDAGTSDVNLSGNVPIGEMFFESANSYTFSGDGVISGEGGLIVSGTGTLNMTKYNEYVGPTVIKSGTLAVPFLNYGGQPSSLGAAGIEEANLVIDGGVLLFRGAESNTNRGMTFGENGAEIEMPNANSKLMLEGKTLGGTLVKSGPGRLILEGAKAHAKTVLRGGRISLFGDVASPGSSLVIESGTFDSMDDMGSYNTMTWSVEVPEGGSGTLNLDSRGTYTGKLTGSGTLYVNIPNVRSDLNGDWSAFAGTLEFSSSYGDDVLLRLNNSKGLPNAHVQINRSVFASNESGNSLAFGALSGVGTLSGAESYQVGAKGTDSEFSGNISAGSLTKVGAGTFKLSTPNAYTGYTLVTDGLLLVDNATGSATGTGGVTVRESGGIGGTGIVEGALHVESGGALYGGYYNSSSNMKVTGKVTMKAGASYHTKLNGLFLSTSHVIAEGGFEAAGDLFVELTGGSYRAGQGFKIIDSGSITGTFESITPAAPADGQYWDTSELYTLGILKTTDQATSIRNLRNNNQLKIYPNPVQDVLEIQLAEVGGEMVVVEIVDVSGQLVVSQMFGSQRSIELNVSQLNQGVYFLRVKTNSQVLTQKITKL
jgi:autotransporter-associated beta strand protein